MSERQLTELGRYHDSDAFDETERLVLDFATALTTTPADVPDDLRDALLQRLSRAQYAELAAAIAWENHRGRLNRALGVRPAGFSDGAACALPSH